MRHAVLAAALALTACSSSPATNDAAAENDAASTDAASSPDTATPTDAACAAADDATVALPDGGTIDLRGVRYCEVLLAHLGDGGITADVYNTLGLSDCPDAAWSALDAAAIAHAEGVPTAILNGPRYWLIDRFEHASLIDPSVHTFGCLPMRLAGRLSVGSTPSSAPYTPHMIMRDTTVVFAAGNMVYELVDDAGHVYDMQSYSIQRTPQDEASLATLGSRLTLPTGWTYRARMLSADLSVTAVAGVATVLQDDFQNSYQLSQQ